MKRTMLLLLGCLLIAAAAQATPVIGVSGQGMDFTFDNGFTPNTYGKITGMGDVSTDDGLLTMNNTGEYAVFAPTNNAATITAMPETEDWAALITFKQTGLGDDFAIFAKTESSTGGENHRLFALECPNADSWNLKFGDGSGGWYNAVTGISMGSDFNTLVIHYKSATGNMDAYLNDTLIAADQAAGYGRYDLVSIQIQNVGGGSVLDIDTLKVGQVVPEPATLSLLAMGGIFALRRRK